MTNITNAKRPQLTTRWFKKARGGAAWSGLYFCGEDRMVKATLSFSWSTWLRSLSVGGIRKSLVIERLRNTADPAFPAAYLRVGQHPAELAEMRRAVMPMPAPAGSTVVMQVCHVSSKEDSSHWFSLGTLDLPI